MGISMVFVDSLFYNNFPFEVNYHVSFQEIISNKRYSSQFIEISKIWIYLIKQDLVFLTVIYNVHIVYHKNQFSR